MPTPPLEEPTTKVTMLLWSRDVAFLKRKYPNYTTKVRELVRAYCLAQAKLGVSKDEPYLEGDFDA